VRVREASARIGKARLVIAGSIGAGVLAAAPWLGWWTLLLFAPIGVHLVTVEYWLQRSEQPELIAFGSLLLMLGMFGLSAALTGGPTSPVLPWAALIPAMATIRFRLEVGLALAGVSAAVIVGVGFASDPQLALDNPVPMIAAVVMLANIVGICVALMSGELEHRDLAVLDPLTGLLNRASLDSRATEIEQQARLTSGPVSVVILDLDDFKQINDEYGHDRGDDVLRDTAEEIRSTLRSYELVYRIGGEEFLVLLPGVDIEEGIRIAERVRTAIADSRPGGLDLTLSAGVATASGAEVRYGHLFRAADGALLRAKREGRDRLVAASESLAVTAA
jgi:diguanylate cyclase (GGDEF)-like protein